MPKLTLPLDQRPEWLRRDGMVMIGSWEPLLFRVRRDGAPGYTPTAEQRAAYEREHSPEMVARLKALGVNFVMMHCYKGGGLEAERESMAEAVKFAKLCHDAGLRVGTYTYSGSFIWELFFQEKPQAIDWVIRHPDGSPVWYRKDSAYRYYWNRNHPDAREFYRGIVKFAVEEVRTDLVHFDNYHVAAGHDAYSIARFRQYLRDTFAPEVLRANGIPDVATVTPPGDNADNLLARAWTDFSCQMLAQSFHDMTRYARTLRPDILMETNPGGVGPVVYRRLVEGGRAVRNNSPDHGRLLRGGEATCDEGREPGFAGGKLQTRIRTFKSARGMDNTAFVYVLNPLEAAESMAFNLDCFGIIGWFEYGEITNRPGRTTPISADMGPCVEFFHRRRDLFRDARVVADVGVLRSFPSMFFGPAEQAKLPGAAEEVLIAGRTPFQIVFDQQLDELSRWPVLMLAGCVALSDAQVKQIRNYVASGGRLCVVGPLATHDEWMLPRKKPALDDLPAERVVRVDEGGDWLAAIRRARGGQLSLSVTGDTGDALVGLCTELADQRDRRLVHLVNYRSDQPAKNVTVRVALPKGRSAKSVALASPGRRADLEVPLQQQPGFATFTVPAIGVYEIAVVTLR